MDDERIKKARPEVPKDIPAEEESEILNNIISDETKYEYHGPPPEEYERPPKVASEASLIFYDVVAHYQSEYYIESKYFGHYAKDGRSGDPKLLKKVLGRFNVTDPDYIFGIVYDGPVGEGEGLLLMITDDAHWLKYDFRRNGLLKISGDIKQHIKTSRDRFSAEIK